MIHNAGEMHFVRKWNAIDTHTLVVIVAVVMFVLYLVNVAHACSQKLVFVL